MQISCEGNYITFDGQEMTIQAGEVFFENLNPSSVVNAGNIDLTKLPVDIFRTSLITDIGNPELDNKELRFDEVANKEKIRNIIFRCFIL